MEALSDRLDPAGSFRRSVIIGDTLVARRVCATLIERSCAGNVTHLVAPTDAQLEDALVGAVDAVAILIRDDVAALRYALAVAHLDPGVPMIVTIFDQTIAGQIRSYLPQATVMSPASLAAPSIAGPCISPELTAAYRVDGRAIGVQELAGTPVASTIPAAPSGRSLIRRAGYLLPNLRTQHAGSHLLVLGLGGLVTVLLVDWVWLSASSGRGLWGSFADAARVVATVGPGAAGHGSAYAVFAGLAMLLTIGFTALFTAGMVDTLVKPPTAALVGRRSVPRRGHLIVVGIGQVGVRLAALLGELGIPVVGVERDPDAPYVALAQRLGVPVVIADGTDRRALERLGLARSRGVAAVASDELANIAVAVTAAAIDPTVAVTLRAGEQEALVETRSLLRLGATRDVTALACAFVVAHVWGLRPESATVTSAGTWVRLDDGSFTRLAPSRHDDCRHEIADPALPATAPANVAG